MEGGASTGTDLFAIVGSAGGIVALRSLLAGLEAGFPAPILCCQHLPPVQSHLREVLARETELEVRWAEDGGQVEPGVVFLAPPGTTLVILADGTLRVRETTSGLWFPAIDAFLRSVAEASGKGAVVVVLSGMASVRPSLKALASIRSRGGRVIVQDEASSEHWGMPSGALVTGVAERILPLREIAAELATLAAGPARPAGDGELARGLESILDTMMALDRAPMGNVQLFDPARGSLRIVAQRGFARGFLDHFRVVHFREGSACARAIHGERVVVEDVEADRLFAPHRAVVRSAGFLAVQSTPILTRSMDLVGVVSTHRRTAGPFPEWDRKALLHRAAGVLVHCAREPLEV